MNSTFYEDIMNLMNEGKSSEDIATLMVEALNKAQEERNAKLNAEATKAKKISYMKRFADLVNEYFETFEPGLLDGIEITEDECIEMLETLEELVKAVKSVKSVILDAPETGVIKISDDASCIQDVFGDIWNEINNIKRNATKPNPEFKPPVHVKVKPKTDDDVIKEFLDTILK